MNKLVIYDLDGTLIDSVNLFMEAYKYSLKNGANITLDSNALKDNLGPNEIGVFKNITPLNYKKCLELFYEYEKKHTARVALFDGVGDLLLKSQNNHIQQAIVTGRANLHAKYYLNHFRIENFFSDLLVGSPLKDVKVSNIQFLLNKYGVDNSNAIYLGDTLNDVIAAKSAKITACICLWGKTKSESKQILESNLYDKAFYTVKEFEDWLIKGIIDEY